MSLSRILNDQPAPDPPRSELAASAPSPRPGSRASGSSTHVPEDDANQVAVRWEHYDPTVPQGGRPAAATVLEVEASASATPEPASATRSRNGHTAAENGTSASTGTRRKRKPVDVNGKQTTDEPSERRYGLRRRPPKNKQYQPDSPTPNGTPEPPVQVEFAPTEEELRLASSDLEDTEEIWKPELEAYILDSHRRQKYVSEWFRNSSYDHGATTVQSLVKLYQRRAAAISLPPPPPPPPPPSQYTGRPSYDDVRRQPEYIDVDAEEDFTPPTNGWDDVPSHVRDGLRRTMSGVSEQESELDPSGLHGPSAAKRRRVEGEPQEIALLSVDHKGKGRALPIADDMESLSGVRGRKKPKKRGGDGASVDESPSRGISPAPSVASAVYEIGEMIPPLKKARKADDATMVKRLQNLQEAQKKVWYTIARKDVVKVYRYTLAGYQARVEQKSKIALNAANQARKPYVRSAKTIKDTQAKGKRLMREMLQTWKKNEREERDVRKREQKEAVDRARVEDEKREAARQARKLEFLISQTELYSHFVGNKLKTAEIEGETVAEVPMGAEFENEEGQALVDINYDDDDETNLYRHASRNAQGAIAAAIAKAATFDKESALERKTNEAIKLAKAQAHVRDDATPEADVGEGGGTNLLDLDSDELNFQNPTSLQGELTVQQPNMLNAQLKEYQLKGLNWLATLYEQGINGILADEMGLGKTVQSISLIAHLAEKHDIWGPILIVSPTSTLHNWQQELARFAPKLKALPYWGPIKDRTTLRKIWCRKDITFDENAPFHIIITSYNLVTQDQQYFQKLRWQYMILDEAQNIKNASSLRWKTLLGLNCRNRLLLTGTPIQNSMQELWALLHFIMPSLFDSHDEFNEWFSKDVEGAAEKGNSRLSEHQLRRLHMILKPFMLRRVKRHVQNELGEKIEEDLFVDLTHRQRNMYRSLLSDQSVRELLRRAKTSHDGPDVETSRYLMNVAMQFRKVCNHPELFARADVDAPYSFVSYGRSGPLRRDVDVIHAPYSSKNPIDYSIPELFYLDGGLVDVPREDSSMKAGPGVLAHLMNVWSPETIVRSLSEPDSSWAFLKLVNCTPAQAHTVHVAPLLRRSLMMLDQEAKAMDDYYPLAEVPRDSWLISSFASRQCPQWSDMEPLMRMRLSCAEVFNSSCLSRAGSRVATVKVVAPPVTLYCRNRSFLEHQECLLDAPTESLALYGLPVSRQDSEADYAKYRQSWPHIQPKGLFGMSPPSQLPPSTMEFPEAKSLIYNSGKLARLDTLLQELKRGDHRVLIYSQMTRMMDLMEEYLIYRQYKYLRLDGSTKMEDRRDMVIEWQTRPDIFVFLLSTRAGGLGINLTAADTVVFYDQDWNPSNDAQAMDRAHRLGQTRQVTVYRLITRRTIDERILAKTREKKDIQDIVVGNKTLAEINSKPPAAADIVQMLLAEEEMAGGGGGDFMPSTSGFGQASAGFMGGTSALFSADDGDDFFGQTVAQPAQLEESVADDVTAVAPTRGRGRGRGRGSRGGTGRGRGRGAKADGEPSTRGRRRKAAAADA